MGLAPDPGLRFAGGGNQLTALVPGQNGGTAMVRHQPLNDDERRLLRITARMPLASVAAILSSRLCTWFNVSRRIIAMPP